MNVTKLLIADGSEEFAVSLQNALQGTYQVRIVQDGKEALAMLESFRPDVLVLDLILPSLDGITLLQTAASAGNCPMVLAMSGFFSGYVVETLTELGVGYIMRKPCQVSAVAARIRDLSHCIHPPRPVPSDPKLRISNILMAMSFKTKWDGTLYLKEAITRTLHQVNPSVTKELYPAIAALYGSRPELVERSIRSAIETAWLHRDDQIWRKYFPAGADGIIPRPTNADFIARLAEVLRYP